MQVNEVLIMEKWEVIGSGQALSVEKNTLGGYDVVLKSNATVGVSSYILLARTTKLVDKGTRKQYE